LLDDRRIRIWSRTGSIPLTRGSGSRRPKTYGSDGSGSGITGREIEIVRELARERWSFGVRLREGETEIAEEKRR
jgi:hypothetical protein